MQGCSYHSIYPWLHYAANPNLGRRKRQTLEKQAVTQDLVLSCNRVAKKYVDALQAAKLDNLNALSLESLSTLCQSESSVNADAPKYLQQNFDALLNGIELGKKYINQRVVEATLAEQVIKA